VPRLIDAELSTSGKRQLRQQPPAFILHWVANDAVFLHLCDERLDIVAHQLELVDVVLVGRMHGNFRWWQSKDQPPIANIDIRQL
jgi:hypothetical protein